jgi:hypothetical protein
MRRIFWPKVILALLIGGAAASLAATLLHVGAESVDDEVGVSLRDESVRQHGSFFRWYGRSHRGSGLGGGK